MSPSDPATAAFLRYLRQEVDILRGPIEAGCQHVAGCGGSGAPEIVRTTLRSIAGYFVRMSGAMTEPTAAFWRDVVEFFESQLGAFAATGEHDKHFFANILETNQPSELFGFGAVDLAVLRAVLAYDRENNSTYLGRTKMLLWRFAAAFVAADHEGTIDEEAALAELRKLLDTAASAAPETQQTEE